MSRARQLFTQIFPFPQSIAQIIKAEAFLLISPNRNHPPYSLPTIVRCLEFQSEQQAVQNQFRFESLSNAFHLRIINTQVKHLAHKNVWGLIIESQSPQQSLREKLNLNIETGASFTQNQLILIINCISIIFQKYFTHESKQSLAFSQILDLFFITEDKLIKLAQLSLLAPLKFQTRTELRKLEHQEDILTKLSVFIFEVLTLLDKRNVFNFQLLFEKIKALQFKTFAMKCLKNYLQQKITIIIESQKSNSVSVSKPEKKFPQIRCLKSSKIMQKSSKKGLESPFRQQSQRREFSSVEKSKGLNKNFMSLNEMVNDKIVESFQQDEYSYILQSNNSSPSRISPYKGFSNTGLIKLSPEPSLHLFSPSQSQQLNHQASRYGTETQSFQIEGSLSNSKTSNMQNSNLNSIILEVEEESNYEIMEKSSLKSDIIDLSFSQNNEDGIEMKELRDLQNGTKYFGEVVNGLKHGKGKMFYLDGGYYEGDWKENTISGFGKLFYPSNKLAYAGYWKDGCFHGPGLVLNQEIQAVTQFDYIDFSNLGRFWISYRGNFNMDVREGFGVVKLSNGDFISGNWENNSLNGEAEYKKQDGSVIKGVWKSNRLQKILKREIGV